jgi:GntR family transcriptional regulator / MocR family aminotransferase
MPKRATTIHKTDIVLDHGSSAPLYRQLYERLRAAILSGQLEDGARLPSTRALASAIGVSRTTTALVYDQLLMEGYIESRVGAGTHVAQLRARPPEDQKAGNQSLPNATSQIPAELSQRGRALLHASPPGELYSSSRASVASPFRAGQPDTQAFPYQLWAKLLAKRARHSLQTTTHYQEAAGYYPLREAIAAHIGITRGVRCTPEQVLITAGSQGALDLAARVLLDPGDTAWVEDPGYLGARGALLAAGAQVVPVPVDTEGIDVAAGHRLAPHARIVSVTPSHQFPTGITMSLSRRVALLEWARQAQAWILEDDYDSEYRFSGRPLEALQGLDNGQRVIYIGTFSKVLFPTLRLGYVVVPPELVAGFVAMRRFIDVHVPILEQVALADFMIQGHFTRHLRHMRTRYTERRNVLIEALRRECGDLLDVQVPEAGMHLVAWLPAHLDDRAVARLVLEQGIEIAPISKFCIAPPSRGGLMLGYANASSEELRDGVRKLARALRKL